MRGQRLVILLLGLLATTAGNAANTNPAAATWAALDAAWAARDAQRFAATFTDEASLAFVDRDQRFEGRPAIEAEFTERFRNIGAPYTHQATVLHTRLLAPGVMAVDGLVEVRRAGLPFRKFWTVSVLVDDGPAWRFAEMRIFQQPGDLPP